MAKGRCLKCNTYGDVEYHHPNPKRWFGRGSQNSWTEPLCATCHIIADGITYSIDQQCRINSQAEARYYRALFTERFTSFVNGELVPA